MKKKNKKLIIFLAILWIPLSVVLYLNLEDKSMVIRIIFSILSGPVLYLLSGFGSLGIALLMLGSYYISKKLDFFKLEEKNDYIAFFTYSFYGAFWVILFALYYFTITNKHLFYRIYGGW